MDQVEEIYGSLFKLKEKRYYGSMTFGFFVF